MDAHLVVPGIDNMGATVPGNESSIQHSFPGTKVPGSERAGSESSRGSRERIGQGPIVTFAAGSELARERKGRVPALRYDFILQKYCPSPSILCIPQYTHTRFITAYLQKLSLQTQSEQTTTISTMSSTTPKVPKYSLGG